MDRKYAKTLTTTKTIIVSLVVIIAGLIGYVITSDHELWTNLPILHSLVRDLSNLLILSFPILLIWELYLKRSFAEEIIGLMQTSNDVLESKLVQISFDPQEINWKGMFEGTKDIDILFTYGKSWRGNNERLIKNYLNSNSLIKGKIRIIIPDFNNEVVLNELAIRYEKSIEGLRERIKTAISDFVEMDINRKNGPKLEIWLIKLSPVFASYRFDNNIILSLYSHKGKMEVPHFITEKEGKLYKYVKNQIDTLLNPQSKISNIIYDSTQRRLPIQILIFPFYIEHNVVKYLLLKRIPDRGAFWQGITGGVIENEDISYAAKRELFEETKIKEKIIDLNFSYEFPIGKQWKILHPQNIVTMTEHVFICKLSKKHVPVLDENEHTEWGYFTFMEVNDKLKWPENKNALKAADEYITKEYLNK